MIKLIIGFLFIVTTCISGQDTLYISLLGHDGATSPTTGYEAIIYFEENRDRCDPEIGFISMEMMKAHFEESLLVHEIDFNTFEYLPLMSVKNSVSREYYFYKSEKLDDIVAIRQLCEEQLVNFQSAKEVKPYYSDSDEYVVAVGALEDTQFMANRIADHLGFDEVELLSIDDLTQAIQPGIYHNYFGDRRTSMSYTIRGNYRLIR